VVGVHVPGIESVASSRVRMSIALLLTVRPRTLTELAELTGVSIQGVLKHTKRLERDGLLAETALPKGRYLRRRKLYSMNRGVEGFSREDLLVAAFTPSAPEERANEAAARLSEYSLLESLSEEVIFSRSSLRESVNRMERAISRVAESQSMLNESISEQRSLTDEEKHIAYLYFTEDTKSRVEDVLKTHFGCSDPEAALDDVLAKLRGRR
jgi:predicted transcriptional regulator